MLLDGHVHCDSDDKSKWKIFVDELKRLDTRAVLSFGSSNESVLECANTAPDYLIPYAYFHLWDSVNANDVSRFKDMGFKGLKCIEPYYEYDHDEYMPVYEEAEKLKMPVLFHTGTFRPEKEHIIHKRPLLKNMRPLTIDRIARSFQNLNIVMAHMGTTCFRHEAAELMKMHPNVYADLAGSGSWMSMQPAELRELLSKSNREIDASFDGFKKLILGSDAYITKPLVLEITQDWYNRTLERIGLPTEIIEQIMGGTLSSWLD